MPDCKKVCVTDDIFGTGLQFGTENAINCIKEAPTADVVEVRHGEWIPCGDGEHTPLMCSKCMNTWSFYKQRGSDYCPNCGAKMDGKGD